MKVNSLKIDNSFIEQNSFKYLNLFNSVKNKVSGILNKFKRVFWRSWKIKKLEKNKINESQKIIIWDIPETNIDKIYILLQEDESYLRWISCEEITKRLAMVNSSLSPKLRELLYRITLFDKNNYSIYDFINKEQEYLDYDILKQMINKYKKVYFLHKTIEENKKYKTDDLYRFKWDNKRKSIDLYNFM